MIRFGIVGAGGIAQKFARDIKFSEGVIAAAVASRSLDKAIKFKARFYFIYFLPFLSVHQPSPGLWS